MRGRAGAEWAAHALVAYAAWLALTQRLSAGELLVGAAAAALAGAASLLVWSHNGARFLGQARAAAEAWRLPWYAVTGTLEILGVLGRHLAGRPAPSLMLNVRYAHCADTPGDQALRALAVAYTTATPNFIVLGIDRARGLLWYHQVRRSPVLRMTAALGARPGARP